MNEHTPPTNPEPVYEGPYGFFDMLDVDGNRVTL